MAFQTKFDGSVSRTMSLGTAGSPEVIEGYFVGTKTTQSAYGEGKLHVFQTNEGYIGVWGKTRLNSLLTTDLLGQMVRATFTGMIAPTQKGRRPSYGFKVEHDKDNTIDTSNINLSAASPESEEDEDLDSDAATDEVIPSQPVAPRTPAAAPSAAARAQVQALLSRSPKRV